jgi:uncharacterized protein
MRGDRGVGAVAVGVDPPRFGQSSQIAGWQVWGAAVLLPLYGNIVALGQFYALLPGPGLGIVFGLLPALALVAFARLPLRELGISRCGAGRAGAIGLLVGLGVALPAIVFLFAPPLVGERVTYAPVTTAARDVLWWRAFVWMPLDTALPEEIAFRGVVLGLLLRVVARWPAVVISAVVFTLWHLVVVWRTVALTNLADEPLWLALGLLGSLGAVFVGGLVFAVLRLRTGNLAASITAHWAFNAVLLLGL